MWKTARNSTRAMPLPTFFLLTVICYPVFAYSRATVELPECAVRIDVVREEGVRPPSEIARFLRHRDMAIVLENEKTEKLLLILTNQGKAERFDVLIEAVKGLTVTVGGGSRQITVKSGESAKLPVTAKGGSLAEVCDWESRSLRIVVKPQGDSKICGQTEKRFFCPSQNKKTAGM